MIAFEAEASSTSDSVIAPTPARITRILTFSVESFCSISLSTSAEPPTSVLMMMLSSLTSPSLTDRLSMLEREAVALRHRLLRAPSIRDT